jgi:hypothetical protein
MDVDLEITIYMSAYLLSPKYSQPLDRETEHRLSCHPESMPEFHHRYLRLLKASKLSPPSSQFIRVFRIQKSQDRLLESKIIFGLSRTEPGPASNARMGNCGSSDIRRGYGVGQEDWRTGPSLYRDNYRYSRGRGYDSYYRSYDRPPRAPLPPNWNRSLYAGGMNPPPYSSVPPRRSCRSYH